VTGTRKGQQELGSGQSRHTRLWTGSSFRSVSLTIIAATTLGLVVQVSQARLLGGWSGLIAVGEESHLRELIAAELPSLVLVDQAGHDGQSVYAIGLNPWLRGQPPDLADLTYRYRRILLPVIGGAFGLLSGEPLLWGVTALSLAGFVASAVGTLAIARSRDLSSWLLLAALLNVGLWLSLQNTTPDALAMGLSIVGIAFAFRGRNLEAALLIMASALAKETYWLTGLSLAAWSWMQARNRRAAWSYLAAGLPLAGWSLFLAFRLREQATEGVLVVAPFQGLMEAWPFWYLAGRRDYLFSVLSLLILGCAMLAIFRTKHSVWRYLLAPWIVIALISSHWVWDLGNNSLRVLAPLMTLSILALADKRSMDPADQSIRHRTELDASLAP
jgi:hypothetical protein